MQTNPTPEQWAVELAIYVENKANCPTFYEAALAIQAAFAERDARLVGALNDVGASLTAAISLLERGGKAAKKAAPSDRMFDQMLKDYSASLERARATLAALKDRTHG